MKRFLFHGALLDLFCQPYDVVIVGGGIAGLYAALCLDPALSCIVLNKSDEQESNSMYAQGGIAAVIAKGDDPEQHLQDTLVAGAGLCNEDAVRLLVTHGTREIERLVEMGVPFDRDTDGTLLITREGGHHQNRIVHCGGDATGLHVTQQLLKLVQNRPNITVLDGMFLMDLITDDTGVCGVIAMQDDAPICFAARKIILATGGIGRVYRNSTNARCSTGDGIAAAMRAGATLSDMEFVQFHPTALIHPDNNGRFFLITEALRGEGAVLRNRRWQRFMADVHPMADLAPRDIVTRAIIREMRKNDLPHVYLDITARPRAFLKKRFPTIYNECMRRDIDIAIDWIPVVPVQHYFMGGVATDLHGKTSIPGLYACGETACTGIHGANRLASNSLLECLVFGRRCAEDINGSPVQKAILPALFEPEVQDAPLCDTDAFRTEIRELMTKKGGIIRNHTDMTEASDRIESMQHALLSGPCADKKEMETLNMATTALCVLQAAILRKRSVGAHYRSDDKTDEGAMV